MARLVTWLWALLNSLFVKIILAFWGILLLTLVTGFIIIEVSEQTDFALPHWGNRDLRQAEFISRHPPPNFRSDRTRSPRGPFPPRPQLIVADEEGALVNTPELGELDNPVRNFIFEHTDAKNPKLRILNHHQVIFGPRLINRDGEHQRVYLIKFLPTEQINQLRNLAVSPKKLLGLLVLFSLLACMGLAWHIARPLKKLRNAANQIARGELSATLPDIHRRDEIGQLSISLSRMSQTMANAITNQRRLLSDISHELRSPLTRLNMAVALSNKRNGQTAEMARVEKESQRLEEMIRALLGLSRMQLEESELQDELLGDLLSEMVIDCQFEASQLGKEFIWLNDGPEHFNCYPDVFLSAIENICRNALKYANHRTTLRVHPVTKGWLTISVEDDGPGIDESELDQIFRPFYRASQARDRNSGGVGLGLAITDWSVRQHGGFIKAENRSGQHRGLIITITLPYTG